MRDRHPGRKCRNCPTKRARSIALDEQQGWRVGEHIGHRPRYRIRMGERVALARAVERDPGKRFKTIFGRIEGMLAGEQQAGLESDRRQRKDDGREFDRLGTSADDEVDTRVPHIPPSSATRS